ncbi:MAG: hypothetical protein CVU03_14115 [Bacteroidetes bacterium HGW-Bacteroidetes-2]|jgi:hypothetical protein|nr:MAG: hypothetical protein CVU03_14115 [Bacteroidetes bacterium HGW-Bacteroidetes-2]
MKGYFLKENMLYCFTGLLLFININCSENVEFQRINFDFSKDYIAELARGFKSKIEYDYWACVRSGYPDVHSISILYETKDLNTNDNFKLLGKGFYRQGHIADSYYYIVTIKDGNINYITEVDKLQHFFGKIDTMEEALMIAKINGFLLDYNDLKGSSFRKVKNGFEFLLMKSEESGLIEFRQYLVSIDKKGSIKSEKREIYCRGYEECYEK